MIRTVRKVLDNILKDHQAKLDLDSFATLLCEVEYVVNSRPLTPESLTDPTSEVITTNHILTMKGELLLPPPGVFQRDDQYLRKRWRFVQYLANQFWYKWRKEYLSLLQERQKWKKERRNLNINDIVLVRDDDVPRAQWPLARIINVFPSEDGLVRSVELVTAATKNPIKRPVQKLVVLLESQ